MCLLGIGVSDRGVLRVRDDGRGGGVVDCTRRAVCECSTTVAMLTPPEPMPTLSRCGNRRLSVYEDMDVAGGVSYRDCGWCPAERRGRVCQKCSGSTLPKASSQLR